MQPVLFVVHDGVQFGDFAVDLPEQLANERGVFHAFQVFGLVMFVGLGDGVAVGAEVGDKIRREFVFVEPGAEGGFFRLGGDAVIFLIFEGGQHAVGVGEDGDVAGVVRQAEGSGKAVLLFFNLSRGAGEIGEVNAERVEQGGLGGAGGHLSGAGDIQFDEQAGEVGEVALGFAAGGEVSRVVDAEGLDAIGAFHQTNVLIFHKQCFRIRSSL